MKYLILIILLFLLSFQSRAQSDTAEKVSYYYPNGIKSSEGYLVKGKPDGYWISYYPTGIKKSEGNRIQFLLEGKWVFYFESGDTSEIINYSKGKKYGFYLTFKKDLNASVYLYSKEIYINDIKEGIAYYYHANGFIKEKLFYNRGIINGRFLVYNDKGNIVTEKIYRDNEIVYFENIDRTDNKNNKIGLWKEFFDDNSVASEAYYIDNKLHGTFKQYNKNGNVELIVSYEHGTIKETQDDFNDSIEIKYDYHNNGSIAIATTYRNGKPIGIQRFYNDKGSVINAKTYNEFSEVIAEGIIDDKGIKSGNWKYFYKNGKTKATGNYSNNNKTGKWLYYYENGNVELTGNYNRDKMMGIWYRYYLNANLWIQSEYLDNMLQGSYTEFSDMGDTIVYGYYDNNERIGKWIFKIGDTIESGNYLNDMKEGDWYIYYNNGNLYFKGSYLQDNPHGKHLYYYRNGKLMEERIFDNGNKRGNWKKYDENGMAIIVIQYKNNTEYKINGLRIK